MNDQQVVAAQLGRPLRSVVEVVARCHLDLPVASAVPPILDDGTPFPTRFWLGCPLAVRRIARLESAGAIGRLEAFIADDPDRAHRLEQANERYAEERDVLVPDDAATSPRGGVGGNEGEGLKCLHAHYADYAAGNDNPVGEMVVPFVEPLDCSIACVRAADDGVELNPEWQEPR